MRVPAWFAICAALFERAADLQVSGDARGAKGVVADARRNAGGFRAPLNHRIGVGLGQRIAGELAGRAAVGLEQQRLRLGRQPRAVAIFMQVSFQIVMAGHGVLLAALLLQAHPQPPVLRIHVVDLHADRRADAGEGIAIKPISARSRRPMIVVASIASMSCRASCGSSTGVLPRRTIWRGPRTAAAGLTGMIWPMTSQFEEFDRRRAAVYARDACFGLRILAVKNSRKR